MTRATALAAAAIIQAAADPHRQQALAQHRPGPHRLGQHPTRTQGGTVTFHLATPEERARMSWHQRQRYDRNRLAYWRTLEATERPKPREQASAPRASAEVATAIWRITELITPLLPPPVECGTVAGHRVHRRNGERPCDPCRIAYNEYAVECRTRRRALAVAA